MAVSSPWRRRNQSIRACEVASAPHPASPVIQNARIHPQTSRTGAGGALRALGLTLLAEASLGISLGHLGSTLDLGGSRLGSRRRLGGGSLDGRSRSHLVIALNEKPHEAIRHGGGCFQLPYYADGWDDAEDEPGTRMPLQCHPSHAIFDHVIYSPSALWLRKCKCHVDHGRAGAETRSAATGAAANGCRYPAGEQGVG